MKDVIVIVGAGFIGAAIARRIGFGKHILLSGLDEKDLKKSKKSFYNAGFDVSIQKVDISSKKSVKALVKKAVSLGRIKGVVNSAGVSPSQASIQTILKVDLYGTALVLEEFGKVISKGASAVVISSQSGHRMKVLSQEEDKLLATTKVKDLLNLEITKEENLKDTLHAYQLAKRANGLRVMYEAIRWGKKGARVNTISPGIIITPLANDELNGPRGDFYKNMIESSPVKRAGTPDEVANLAKFLMEDDGGFITGSDFLIDGGSTSAFKFSI